MFLLKEYIKICLLERRRSGETGEERLQNERNTLKQYVDKGYFFHMTDDYKLQGINVKTHFTTPFGIYFFPLTQEFYDMILKGSLPLGDLRPYILICKVNGNVIKTSEYSWDDFKNDYQKLKGKKLIKNYPQKYKLIIEHPMSALLYLVYGEGRKKFETTHGAILATKNLLKLGYSGLYDDLGIGVIHENEPTQAVIFGSKYCNIIDVVNNEFAKQHSKLQKDMNNIINKFLYKTDDEKIDLINKLVDQQCFRLLDTLYKNNNNIKFNFSDKVQEAFFNKNNDCIKYFQDIPDFLLEKISNLDIRDLWATYDYGIIPDQIVEYLLIHKKDLLLKIEPTLMKQKFSDILSKNYKWVESQLEWIKL